MEKNMGIWDRWLRFGIGVCLFSLLFWAPESSFGWLGVYLLWTAGLGHCPIYLLLDIQSASRHTTTLHKHRHKKS